ncbi:hypothetical protein CAP35_06790 [Chitinophagaceae bacterium IBVUCB1]|nr:hypothetical protein CAP35_06790 [Chitinophagaceae bacterium IBVUCB1]
MYRKSYWLFTFCICFLMLNSANAQGILIKDRNGITKNGDTVIVIPEPGQKPPYTEMSSYFFIHNINSNQIVLKARKRELTYSSTAEHSICFAGMCYTSSIYTAPGFVNLQGGKTDSSFSGHYRYLATTHTPTKDLVAYTFYDENNPADSAIVYVIYNSMQATSVPCATMSNVRIYPNPAGKTINIDIPNLSGKANIHICDMAGSKLLVADAATGHNAINIETLPRGTYILSITQNGLLMLNHKLDAAP